MPELVIDPIAKAVHVNELLPDHNYDGETELWACVFDLFGSYYGTTAYLECDISALDADAIIGSASKLEVYVTHRYTDSHPMNWLYATDAWVEDELTWDSQGSIGAPMFIYTGPSADGAFTITGAALASWLQTVLDDKGGLASWATYIVGFQTSEQGFRFNSDDAAANKPKLTVVYTLPGVGPILRPGKYLY